jgi:cysteine desulfurase family protein
MEKVYYFDHAASSWPKPPEVWHAMQRNIERSAANPGRGSHKMAIEASRTLFGARRELAKLFNISNPNDISYTLNTTMSLNLAIKGYVKEGDHVICSSVEHNSVRRPIEYLKQTKKVEVTYVSSDEKGHLNLDIIKQAFQPNTSLFVITHASNLLGTIYPIEEIAELCRSHKVKLLVDAAQTAGTLPIDVKQSGIDMIAFPGHKGLLGPQGTGGLYIDPSIELEVHIHGGTGSQSEAIAQPLVRPDRYESGTQNTVGIAGLGAGLKVVSEKSVKKIYEHEFSLIQRLMEQLLRIDGVKLLGPNLGEPRVGLVSFTMEGIDSSEVAFILDQSYNIAVRSGYHCTPLAHETAGTVSTGAIRASVGFYTNDSEVDYLAQAIKEIRNHYSI